MHIIALIASVVKFAILSAFLRLLTFAAKRAMMATSQAVKESPMEMSVGGKWNKPVSTRVDSSLYLPGVLSNLIGSQIVGIRRSKESGKIDIVLTYKSPACWLEESSNTSFFKSDQTIILTLDAGDMNKLALELGYNDDPQESDKNNGGDINKRQFIEAFYEEADEARDKAIIDLQEEFAEISDIAHRDIDMATDDAIDYFDEKLGNLIEEAAKRLESRLFPKETLRQ